MKGEIIDGVREYYGLPNDVPDEFIEEHLGGSLGEAVVNLRVAVDGFKKAFRGSVPMRWMKWAKGKSVQDLDGGRS